MSSYLCSLLILLCFQQLLQRNSRNSKSFRSHQTKWLEGRFLKNILRAETLRWVLIASSCNLGDEPMASMSQSQPFKKQPLRISEALSQGIVAYALISSPCIVRVGSFGLSFCTSSSSQAPFQILQQCQPYSHKYDNQRDCYVAQFPFNNFSSYSDSPGPESQILRQEFCYEAVHFAYSKQQMNLFLIQISSQSPDHNGQTL